MPIEIRGSLSFPGSPAYVAARKKLTEAMNKPGITRGQRKHFEELRDELGAAREQENDALIAPVLEKMSFNENASPYNRAYHKIEEGLNRNDLTSKERTRLEELRRELERTKYLIDPASKEEHTPESRRYQHEGIEQVVQNLLDKANPKPKVTFQTDAERAKAKSDAEGAKSNLESGVPKYAPAFDLDDRSEGWEQRKEAYFEEALRSAKAELAAEEAARSAKAALPPEEAAKTASIARRAARAASNASTTSGDNFDSRSEVSGARSETGDALNVASAKNQELMHEKQKELDNYLAENQAQGFKIEDLPEPKEGEHYLTTMNEWLANKIMEYAGRNVTHPNEVAVDSPLIAIAEERLLKKMKDGEKLSPDEQRLKSYFTEVYRKRDEPTESEEILQSAMNPISRPEVEELMNPHLESMMDVMAKRANRHFIEERDRRIKEHEKRELSAFSGSNWNSGARKKFNTEFYDQEQKRRRDFEENLLDQEAKLLFQGDIEGWARARGNRDALERASQNKESITRNKFNNTSDAVKQNVMLDEARKNRIMSHTMAARNVGLDATQRNQDFLNRMSAQNHRNEAEPFNRLTAASAAINGRQPFPVQPTSIPAYNPPAPTRSGYSDAGALALAAQGGMAQQQNLAQQNEYYRLQNEEAKRRQAQAALPGGVR